MFRAHHKSIFLLLGLLSFPVLLQGQNLSKGALTGVVRDLSGAALADVTISLQSPFGERTATTGPGGEYLFPNLPAGAGYMISLSKEGFQGAAIADLVVHANRHTTADVTLEPRRTGQVLTMETSAAEIDFTAAATGTQLAESLFQQVPVQRNVSAVVAMAPGVSGGGTARPGNPSISGASPFENQYLVNSANAADPGYGAFGPAQAVFGPTGSGVNFDFLKEAQVVTGGADARYGQALGGTVNLATKEGGNEYHGTLYTYFQPREFEAGRPNANRLTTSQRTQIVNEGRYDFGGDLGGYLIRNKLFFYGGFNPQYLRSYRRAPAVFTNSRLGEVLAKSRSLNYTAKLTWNWSPKHQFEGSVFGDPSATPMGFTRVNALAADNDLLASKLNFGSRVWTGRYTGEWTPRWLFTANFSQYFSEFRETPKHEGYQVIDNTAVQRGTGGQIVSGGLGLLENTESRVNQLALSSTHRANWFGSHVLSYGFQYEDANFDRTLRYTGAQFTLPDRPEFGAAAGRTQYGASLVRRYLNPADPASPIVLEAWGGNHSNPFVAAQTWYKAAYVEDSWVIGRRLTIRPGLRWEHQRVSGSSHNPSFGDNWAPRIGVIFDPTGDRLSKAFFNWGRFYQRIPAVLAAGITANQQAVRGALYRDQGGSVDLSPANYIGGSGQTLRFTGRLTNALVVARDPSPGYQDEIAAGYEREFGRTFTFSGRFLWRDLRRVLEDVAPISVSEYEAGVPQQLMLVNPSAKNWFFDPERTYKAMELVMTKRFGANWQTFASYRLAKLSGNYEGLFRSDAGLLAPYMSTMFDFANTDGRLLDQARTGVLPLDRRHSLKLFGNYQFTNRWLKNLNVGGAWNIESGTPISRYMAHPAYNIPGEVISGSRGALGRTDWTYPVDIHADYTWKVAEGKNVKFVADLFNLFNQKRLVHVDQNFQLSKFTANPDFLKPNTVNFAYPYQVPFHARLGVRFEF
jgi:hypothetical protein